MLIQHAWNGLFWALTSPKYCSNLLKCWPKVVSNKKKTVFEKSFKILDFCSNGTCPKFTALVHLGAQVTAGKPKTLLKTARATLLRISSNEIPRSQKNQRILVTLSEKTFLGGTKLGLNCPHGTTPTVHQKFSHSL